MVATAFLLGASLRAATIAEVMERLGAARQAAAFPVEGRRTSYRLSSWRSS
jgi:hypothetical protein